MGHTGEVAKGLDIGGKAIFYLIRFVKVCRASCFLFIERRFGKLR